MMVLSKTIGISFSFNSAVYKPFEYILLYLSVKKSNSILAAAISGCVYLILHYGGIYKWWIFIIFLIISFLGYYMKKK